MNDILTQAEQYLDRVGLIDMPGAVLYSSYETLKPGPVYLLGLNPGGSGGETLRDNIAAARRGNNAYLDEEWAPGGHVQPRGQSTLQRRVQTLCRAMGVETRDTPASNLAFTRSTGVAEHPGYAGAVEVCAPVHRLFIDAIEPSFVMTFGSLKHFASVVQITEVESCGARHGTWKAHRGRAVAFGREVEATGRDVRTPPRSVPAGFRGRPPCTGSTLSAFRRAAVRARFQRSDNASETAVQRHFASNRERVP